jgi:hypothetical protein
MLATFLDYGMTTDEAGLNRYGRRLVQWYATLGQDDRAVHWADHFYYGGVFELVNQGIERVLPLDVYETRHLTNTLFGFFGFLAAWGLGSRLAGPFGGFLATIFLVLTPSYYGHAFANPKDVPLASLYAVGAWAALRASDAVPRIGWREGLLAGAAIGLAAGVRVAAIVLFGYAATLWLACLWLEARWGANGGSPWRGLRRVAVATVTAVVTGWAVMIAFWPYGQVKPFRHPFLAWQKFSRFWETVTVLYDGRLLIAREAPREYLPRLLSLTLPEFYPLAALLGGAALLSLLVRRARWSPTTAKRILQTTWVLSLAAAPVAWVVLRHTPLYNGTRHLLFVVPPLAVVAGVSAAKFLGRPGWSLARSVGAAVLAASLLATAADMVRLHPYQYVYYNRLFAGGVAGAANRYELDYWGASFREGIEWMVAHYPEREPGEKVRVAGYSATHVPFWHYLSKTARGRRVFAVVTPEQNPHVLFATTAIREHEQVSGRVLHVVRRLGTPLLYLFETRQPR